MPSVPQKYLDRMLVEVQRLIPSYPALRDLRLDVEYMSGSWYWWRPESDRCVYCTPWWEDADELPLQVNDEQGHSECTDLGVLPYTGEPARDARAYIALIDAFMRVVKQLGGGL